MKLNEMTLEQIKAIPYEEKWDKEFGSFRALVIIPEDELHDSGYKCMSFLLLKTSDEIIARIGGGSDVVHINGISGRGWNWINKADKGNMIKPIDWSIDILPVSGLARLFCSYELKVRPPCSSFEVFAIAEEA